MKNILLAITLLLIRLSLPAQEKADTPDLPYTPVSKSIICKLGDQYIRIYTTQYGHSPTPTFINLHDDEATSVAGARQLLEKKGGLLIRISNNGRRNIRFRLDGKYYTFDPNRVFSRSGIIQTLSTHGRVSKTAIAAVEQFARKLLALIPSNPSYIIALHNNRDGGFSICNYHPGQPKEKDARKVFTADGQDHDDVFLTTDSTLYHQLLQENYNTVLQDNKRARKDGSLSIYFGERNISYLNCETEHGRTSQYIAMIEAAGKYIYTDTASGETKNRKSSEEEVVLENHPPASRNFMLD